MPRRDGTGPMGLGSGRGRGLGNCGRFAIPLLVGAITGICFGLGRNRNKNKTNQGFGRNGFGQGKQQD